MSGQGGKTWGGFFRSLQMKLILVLMVLNLSVMAIIGTFLLNRVSSFYYDEFTSQMNAVFTDSMYSMLVSEAKAEDGATRLKDAVGAFSASLGINSYRNYYILSGTTGSVLAGSDEIDSIVPTPAVLAAIEGRIGQETRLSKGYLDRAVPIMDGETVRYIVYIRDTKQQMQALSDQLFSIILQSLLVGFVISILLSLLLSKQITQPLETLTKSAKRLSKGDFESRPEAHSNDEIGVLTDTFNNMAETLQQTLETVNGERTKLETLFLYLADGVTAFSENGALIHKNPVAEELLGISAEDTPDFASLYGEVVSFDEIVNPASDKRMIECDYAVSGRNLKLMFAAYGENERGVLVVIHDNTEQFKLEEARREFVANVSHELRTPLTNVKSYAETILENPDTPIEMRERFCNVILNETDRMTRIVKDLLTLSRLDYKKMDWKISRFPIAKSIDNVCQAMKIEIENHKHTFHVDLDEELPVVVGDRERLEQVLVNVLSNAVKYTPDGGEITLRAGKVGEMMRISVTDTGLGIPKKDQKRVFERFYRVDKARSRERGGTGLGLAIAKEIVEYHGGEIFIESELGKGTTITFTFACAPKDEGQVLA
ncbi:MAG: HAMP domain-containing protein [Oscillospiraceae bacterium]|nr:HAMP domain-containing protein [Oscillospiraceae bacterium]